MLLRIFSVLIPMKTKEKEKERNNNHKPIYLIYKFMVYYWIYPEPKYQYYLSN